MNVHECACGCIDVNSYRKNKKCFGSATRGAIQGTKFGATTKHNWLVAVVDEMRAILTVPSQVSGEKTPIVTTL